MEELSYVGISSVSDRFVVTKPLRSFFVDRELLVVHIARSTYDVSVEKLALAKQRVPAALEALS